MGKKYIIELLDDCQSEFKGILTFGVTQEKQISIELIPEEDLTPYTEPDLEQVRKEAYEEGFKDGQYAERNGLVANYAQVHKIKIGDEVTAEHGGSTFTVTWMSDRCICGIDSDGRCYSYMLTRLTERRATITKSPQSLRKCEVRQMSETCPRGYKSFCFQCGETDCEKYQPEPPKWTKKIMDD